MSLSKKQLELLRWAHAAGKVYAETEDNGETPCGSWIYLITSGEGRRPVNANTGRSLHTRGLVAIAPPTLSMAAAAPPRMFGLVVPTAEGRQAVKKAKPPRPMAGVVSISDVANAPGCRMDAGYHLDRLAEEGNNVA